MLKYIKAKTTIHSKLLLITASLLLTLSFFFPLWRIELIAPQYPEGLSFSIWSSKFSGDLQTVNILNHYIGMAPIRESDFPELRFFPVIFSVLSVSGILFSLIGRKILSATWVLSIIGFALGALYHFYSWGYKFGHELNPDAPIKMDDMVYQPPLIGEKTILNITAASWPDVAGLAFALAILLAIIAIYIDYREHVKNLKKI